MRLYALTAARTTCCYQRAYAFDRLGLTGQLGSGAQLASKHMHIACPCTLIPAAFSRLSQPLDQSARYRAQLRRFGAQTLSQVQLGVGLSWRRVGPGSVVTATACGADVLRFSKHPMIGICWDTTDTRLHFTTRVEQVSFLPDAAGCKVYTGLCSDILPDCK